VVDQPTPPPDFDGIPLAKDLLRRIRSGALGSLDRDAGFPFASLVTVATDPAGAPLLLMSRLAGHTRNLEADPRASILLAEGGKGDPLAHPRLTVIGEITRYSDPKGRERFLARHPKAQLYADFADFSFFRMTVSSFHLNGGFARAMTGAASAIMTSLEGAEGLLTAESGALAHLNEDHVEALNLYATRLAGAPAGSWRATGLDPEGLDLMLWGDRTARVPFPERVTTPRALREILKGMADRVRAGTELERPEG
jgi:putative heme iron utilization protein